MNETLTRNGGARRRDSVLLVGITFAAYVGFAAFTILHEGGGNTAHAGVPVDAVRAAAAAAGGGANASAAVTPEAGVDAAIPPGANTAEATSNRGVRTRGLGASASRLDTAVTSSETGGAQLQFIVKFDEPMATEWRDRYLADPSEARRAFDAYARSHAAFAGLRLERMSYAGVATLEYDGAVPASSSAMRQLSNDIVRRLSAADGVDYAEPNLVAAREEDE